MSLLVIEKCKRLQLNITKDLPNLPKMKWFRQMLLSQLPTSNVCFVVKLFDDITDIFTGSGTGSVQASLNGHVLKLKYSQWQWEIYNDFNLNITFTYFNLQYSGETCLQERVAISGNITFGRYCGRRHNWSIFIPSAAITLNFHTFQDSSSQFHFNYQLTYDILNSIMLSYPHHKDFTEIEKKSFISPFSWIYKYEIKDQMYYAWSIFVPKMFKIVLILMTNPQIREYLYVFDGPDYHYSQHAASNLIQFTSSSFQIFIMYLGNFGDLTMNFNLGKNTQNNYKYCMVQNKVILKD